mmetsp:Transcript_19187/g.48789  ORF Transcript_19187/g.48789 Transcript_19187/m.48789 type:complete len:348 (+) Transcript_19187:13-1056(+)
MGVKRLRQERSWPANQPMSYSSVSECSAVQRPRNVNSSRPPLRSGRQMTSWYSDVFSSSSHSLAARCALTTSQFCRPSRCTLWGSTDRSALKGESSCTWYRSRMCSAVSGRSAPRSLTSRWPCMYSSLRPGHDWAMSGSTPCVTGDAQPVSNTCSTCRLLSRDSVVSAQGGTGRVAPPGPPWPASPADGMGGIPQGLAPAAPAPAQCAAAPGWLVLAPATSPVLPPAAAACEGAAAPPRDRAGPLSLSVAPEELPLPAVAVAVLDLGEPANSLPPSPDGPASAPWSPSCAPAACTLSLLGPAPAAPAAGAAPSPAAPGANMVGATKGSQLVGMWPTATLPGPPIASC